MKKQGLRIFSISLLLCTLPASAMSIKDVGVPLSNTELSQYRGGFSFPSNRFINIGISITTSLNGRTFFNSHIANLLIKNGQVELDTQKPASDTGITNVIQNGSGNQFEDISQLKDEQHKITRQHLTNTTQTEKPVINSSDTINNIIQNTVNNSVLGISTVVDINAPGAIILQSSQLRMKLDDAIMLSLP
ncbi:hypothetical protein L3V77_16170 [Vibrio sp. DW001]|uniref:hypothetical protein n=1 Tax=Vibrio sp. DW001 TaxID=2912315 RepID=UPI0023AFE1F2|nr:hypothetical protein [Vibrio sp. DW001]WED26509.1 hypothetical protein L3V77_16170 [Vibrio sp. DW001]